MAATEHATPSHLPSTHHHTIASKEVRLHQQLQLHSTMILEHIALLNTKRIILASQSPRRKAILNQLGLTSFIQTPSGYAEDLDPTKYQPNDFAIETARHKAVDVWNAAAAVADTPDPDLVIAADTVVVLGNEILGKPKDFNDAVAILKKLSGSSHQVVTGCALCFKTKSAREAKSTEFTTHTFAVAATVHFAELSDAEIQSYVATKEPMDKAGAYGIQERGGAFVKGIEGDFYTVMGFPLHGFCSEMKSVVLPEWL